MNHKFREHAFAAVTSMLMDHLYLHFDNGHQSSIIRTWLAVQSHHMYYLLLLIVAHFRLSSIISCRGYLSSWGDSSHNPLGSVWGSLFRAYRRAHAILASSWLDLHLINDTWRLFPVGQIYFSCVHDPQLWLLVTKSASPIVAHYISGGRPPTPRPSQPINHPATHVVNQKFGNLPGNKFAPQTAIGWLLCYCQRRYCILFSRLWQSSSLYDLLLEFNQHFPRPVSIYCYTIHIFFVPHGFL